MQKGKKVALGASLVAAVALLNVPAAQAQLDKILTGAGIIVVIDKFGGEINKAVNKLTGINNQEGKTKVVPILSVGQGAYAGAAQVSGPAYSVDRVQAVAQVEGTVRLGAQLRMKGLVPITNRNVKNSAGLDRVTGVGITGLIDARL